MTYSEIIQQVGKHIELEFKIYDKDYYNTDVLRTDEIKQVKISFNAPLVGTVMKQVEIETKRPLNQVISDADIGECLLKIHASYNDNKAEKSYMGLYIKEKPTYNASERTYTYILGDAMIKTMTEYKAINVTYPIKLGEFAKELIKSQGFDVNKMYFPLDNYHMIIEKDPYEGISDFTYRDALDDIAQANGVLFALNGTDLMIVDFKDKTSKVINDDILKNQNISMGEHYGAINTLVLSRSAESDTVYYPSPLPENPVEYKIVDNILMNGNNRADFMPAILNYIKGTEYDIYDCELVGYGDFEPLDAITIETSYNGEKLTYQSYVFNYEVTISDGYSEVIYAEMPTNTNTDYKVASPDDRLTKSVSIIVDKQNGSIKALAEEVDKNNSKVASLETTVNGIETKVEEIVGGLEKTVTFNNAVTIMMTNIEENAILHLRKSMGSSPSIWEYRYMRATLSTKSDFYVYPESIVFQQETQLPSLMYFLAYDYIDYNVSNEGSLYWTARYHESQSAKNYKEVKFAGFKIINPSAEKLYITLEFKENASGSWFATSADDNEMTVTYSTVGGLVTQEQLSSAITQTSKEIDLSVEAKLKPITGDIETIEGNLTLKVDKDDNNQIVSMLNASANVITLNSNRFVLNSDYLQISQDGRLTCTGAMIKGTFEQYDGNNLAVAIKNNSVELYDWKNSGQLAGTLGSVYTESTKTIGVDLYVNQGNGLYLGYKPYGSTSVNSIISYDTNDMTKTPWVINTANGTMFASNPNGGVTVENGFIKNWNLAGITGEFEIIDGTTFVFCDGLFVDIY